MIKSALIGAATGLAAFAVTVTIMLASVHAAEPGEMARQIGLEMLRDHMLRIDWTPPGYFMVGYTVRVG
jgi:hypothetical protein